MPQNATLAPMCRCFEFVKQIPCHIWGKAEVWGQLLSAPTWNRSWISVILRQIITTNVVVTGHLPLPFSLSVELANEGLMLLCRAECEASRPLGMTTGDINDWQISSSSTFPTDWDPACHQRYGRLYQQNGFSWCAKYKSPSEWLQIDLGVAAKVGITLHTLCIGRS